MDIDRSNIVKSTAGRDRGRLFFVMDKNADFVFLADGKVRRVERPKSKKYKHVQYMAKGQGRITEKIQRGDKVTNSEIRRALAEFSQNGEV